MRKIQSLDDLVLPEKHRNFLEQFIMHVAGLSNRGKIEKLVLFGSCARGEATERSDIDIAAIGEEIDDETLWKLYDCVPAYTPGEYVRNDIIAITNSQFNKYINSFGMVQKYIQREGVDLYGLLQQCCELA